MARFKTLERSKSKAFLAAAGLMLGFVALNGLQAFSAWTTPTWMNILFVAPGLVAAYLGLLGLSPLLSDRAPRLTLASTVVVATAGIAAIGLFIVVMGNRFVEGFQFPFMIMYLITFLTTVLGFILFGVASFATEIPSRSAGLRILAPPTVNILMIVTAPLNPPLWSTFVFSALWAGTLFIVGVALRDSDIPSGRADPTPDSTV